MEVRIRGGGILDVTYPVARILSMTPRIFRRYALWAGSDRPTPRGSGIAFDVDASAIEMSGVVVKELTEDTEDGPLLWGFEDIEPLWSSRVGFIDA